MWKCEILRSICWIQLWPLNPNPSPKNHLFCFRPPRFSRTRLPKKHPGNVRSLFTMKRRSIDLKIPNCSENLIYSKVKSCKIKKKQSFSTKYKNKLSQVNSINLSQNISKSTNCNRIELLFVIFPKNRIGEKVEHGRHGKSAAIQLWRKFCI